MTCDAQTLSTNARCFDCIPPGRQLAVQTLLLARIAGVSTDPNTLSALATCMRCLDGMAAAVQIYLLQILAAGSSGSAARLFQSPDGTIWALSIGNDGSRNSDVSAGTPVKTVLASPDATHWEVSVENDGSWTTTVTGLALTGAWTSTAPNLTVFTITVENDGSFTVT